ncbi:MAG: pilus assembly protein [Clostridiaceae bacterium]|nr:pilus assembly protein [Clostridiaceae bacterium]
MNTKADRNVLYLGRIKKQYNKLLVNPDYVPQYTNTKKNRGHFYPLFREGVLTVEAAFCATAFFLVLFSLLYLFRLLAVQQQTQMALANAGQTYSSFGTKTGVLSGLFSGDGLILWKEEKGICYVNQTETIPVLGSRFISLNRYQQMKIHSYDGKTMAGEADAENVYVFIAENGTVYHREEGCVYLNPGIQEITFDQVAEKRNRSGGKYSMCERCCKSVELTGTSGLYITPYGDSYHVTRQCPGLKRTVRKVLLSEIGAMPACSKCGR